MCVMGTRPKLKVGIVAALVTFLSSCQIFNAKYDWRSEMHVSGGKEEAMDNAINDFMHSCRHRKKNDKFVVASTDLADKNALVVTIIVYDFFIYKAKSISDTSYYQYLPLPYTVIDSNLFYTFEYNEIPTQDEIETLLDFGLIKVDSTLSMGMPTLFNNHKGNFIKYYFCKKDLSIYERYTNPSIILQKKIINNIYCKE